MSASAAGAQQPGADGPSKALEGRWALELYIETPSARVSPLAGQINGEIAFSNTAWWNPTDRFGRHNLDLQSFFGRSFVRPSGVTPFGPGDTSMVTEVSGTVRGDSVGIDFIPRIDHGGLSMWGRFWGDSAKGKWHRRGADGDGRFVLRRVSREAVAVAAIPDGRPVAVAVAVAPAKPLTKAQLRAQARADAAAKAKADALAKAQAHDSVKAQALAAAAAKAAAKAAARSQALAAAKATKDSIAQARVVAAAAAKAAKDSIAQAKVVAAAAAKAARDSVAQSRLAARAAAKAGANATAAVATTAPATTTATAPATTTATRGSGTAGTTRTASAGGAVPNAAPPGGASTLASSPAPGAGSSATAARATPATAVAANLPPGAAPLRVRMYDIASNTYFSTKYSLHLPDGHWLYGTLRTGSAGEGYGPPIVRPPGTYEIEVTDFMCGDKVWFFKNKLLQKVVIQPGVPADVTIDVNVATEPARPSLENKTGAACTEKPGTEK